MATFPSIAPTELDYEAGEIPVKRYRTLSGAIVKRPMGNTPTDHTITATFANRTGSVIRQIFDHYYGQNTTVDPFPIPSRLFSGMDPGLDVFLRNVSRVEWCYAGKPRFQRVTQDIGTILVQFVAEIIV